MIQFDVKCRLIRENGPKCKKCAVTMWHPTSLPQKSGPLHAKATVDHIRPKSKGGNDKTKNLQVLCHRCNTAKGNMLSEQRPVGIRMPIYDERSGDYKWR